MVHSPLIACASVPYSTTTPLLSPKLAYTATFKTPTVMEGAAFSSGQAKEAEAASSAAVGISPDTLMSLLSSSRRQEEEEWGSSSSPSSSPSSSSTLVLDCRPFITYNQGHVAGALNVHCPPILKRRSGGGVLPLENVVPDIGVRERLTSGGHYECLVVYDQLGAAAHMSGRKGAGGLCPAATGDGGVEGHHQSDSDLLMSVLTSVRQQVLPGRLPRLCYLAGGYEAFSRHYPFLCETQQFSPLTPGRPDLCSSTLDERPVEILPHLLLGSGLHASDLDLLRRVGITALVNVSSDLVNHFPAHFRYLHIPVRDSASADLTAWFPQANVFIDQVKSEGGRVLVHCQAGRSRSATICLAYLMRTLGLSLDDAFDHVRSRRQIIDPNLNFMRQLQDYRHHLDQEQQQQQQHCLGGAALLKPLGDPEPCQQRLVSEAASAFLQPFGDLPFSAQQPSAQTPREAVAPISLPSALEPVGLLPPVDSACIIPPPSPAMASDVQCFFFTFASSPEFPLSGGSLTRTPEIPLPS